jgi:type VI secretion system secreted protein Hcp
MPADIFIKIESAPIKGESKDEKHTDELEVQSWSWGVSNTGNTHTATGSGTAKAAVQDLSFSMDIDKATPVMFGGSTKGTHYGKVTLVQRKAGDKPLEFFKVTMENVLISSVQLASSGEKPHVNVSLNFGKFKVEYTPQTDKGGEGSKTEFAWDIPAGKPA